MAETKDPSLLKIAFWPLAIFIATLAMLYLSVKSLIRPTKKNKGKVTYTRGPTRRARSSHSSGVMSSTESSSISVDLPITEMD